MTSDKIKNVRDNFKKLSNQRDWWPDLIFMNKEHNLPYEVFAHNNKSLSGLKINDRYSVQECIGEGNYSQVYKALDMKQLRLVAIKVLDIRAQREKNQPQHVKLKILRNFDQQDKMMKKFCHPNLLSCLDSITTHDLKLIITPYCYEGTLMNELKKRGSFDEEKAVFIIKQLVHAIGELHSKGIIHRDIKLENIYIRNGNYVLGDFGLSKQLQDGETNTNCGSIYSQAPEVRSGKYGFKADIWSLGVIFYCLLSEEPLFKDRVNSFIKQRVWNKPIVPFREKGQPLSSEAKAFLRDTIVEEPAKRMDWKALKKHSLFEDKREEAVSPYYVVPCEDLLQIPDSRFQTIEISDFKQQESPKSIHSQESQELEIEVEAQRSNLIAKDQEQLGYEKMKEYHLGVLQSQYVLTKYINVIEEHKLLDFTVKKNIELMYLMSARCFLNMSPIFNEAKSMPNELNRNFHLFRKPIEALYERCKQKFEHYSTVLTKMESYLLVVIKDKMKSQQSSQEYNLFFTGMEDAGDGELGYTKEDQVKYTQKYLDKLNGLNTDNLFVKELMAKRMKCYSRINLVGLREHEERGFDRVVKKILDEAQMAE